MRASELEQKLRRYTSGERPGTKANLADDEVAIELGSPSVGPHASVGVETVYAGFDWDNGKLLIVPQEPLVRKNLQRDIPQGIIRITYKNDYHGKIRPSLHCPVCKAKLRKSDRYCPKCGQRVNTEKITDVTL